MRITNEQIAHVLELDSKRTQGEWVTMGDDLGICSMKENLWITEPVGNMGTGRDTTNANFIAAAPLMAQIIRHQQEQLRVAREALELMGNNKKRLHESIYDIDCPICSFSGKRMDEHIDKALSLIGDKS